MRKLSLHDVDDVEQFCSQVARMWCSRTQTRLLPADHEDLIQFLVLECWRLSEKFRASSPRVSFRSQARGLLSLKCVDFLRDTRGRTKWQWKDGKSYERKLQEPLRLDMPLGDGGDTLGSTIAAGGSDDEADSVSRGDLALHIDVDLHAVDDCATIQAAAPREAPRRTPNPRTPLKPRRAELEQSPVLRRLYPERTAKLKLVRLERPEVTPDESS